MAYQSPWATPEIDDLRAMARKFFVTEALPHRKRWEAQQCVDREFWFKAGERGLLCAGIPEEYGGGGGSVAHDFAIMEAQAGVGESGFGNQVHSGLVAYYLLHYGTEEQKHRWLPGMATGEIVGAIAMTEPGGGSDLKSLRTSAVLEGDSYIVNGSKTFISNGTSADIIILVLKTDPSAGARGFSLLVLETRGAEGFTVGRALEKAGMKAQDTAELFFDNVSVPAGNLLGEEGQGYAYAMAQLAHERLVVAVWGVAVMEMALAETVAHVKQREAFGGTLMDLQNTRFVLAECATTIQIARVFVDECVSQHLRHELDGTTASMAKYWVSEAQGQVIDKCQQLFGGYGFMLEYPITRLAADARVQRVYAGATEVMKELIARSL